MSISDNIADMLTRIRNGQMARLLNARVYYSRVKAAILDVLVEEGYIAGYSVTEHRAIRMIEIDLKYARTGKPAIEEIHRVSSPGKRVYSAINNLKGYYNNMGIYILSTSKGVVSDKAARKLHVGGEVICKVF